MVSFGVLTGVSFISRILFTIVGMLNKKIRSYQKSFKKYGVSPRALHWVSKEAAEVHYKQLIADLDFEGKSVLDVGCGFGDIIPYILEKSKHFEYIGIDIVPEFIKVAKDTYKNRINIKKKLRVHFLVRDYIKNPLRQKFDVVLCCGALNSNPSNSIRYRKKAIEIMWEYAREVVAFNMSGGYPQPENKNVNRVFYANSLEILRFCFTLTSKIIFRHHYRKRDFTIAMFK